MTIWAGLQIVRRTMLVTHDFVLQWGEELHGEGSGKPRQNLHAPAGLREDC